MGDRDSLPANLKSMQPYLDMATDYESMDPFISYWCRLYVLKQGFILARVEDLPFLLVLMELLEKNKQDLQSKIETTDIPAARAHLQGVVQKLLSWAENVPPLLSLTNVVAKAFESAGMLLDVCSIFGEPNEGEFEKKKFTDPHQANLHSEFQSESTTKKSNIHSQDIGKLSGGISGELQNDEGVAGAERIFIMSNAPLTSVLPSGVDLNAFLAQHKELEFLSKVDSIPRGSGSVGKSSSSATPASQVNIDFQHSLEKYLRDATQLTTDDVCSWIQKQYVGEVNPAFIRALVTAVTESSIEGRGTDSKLNNTVLKNRTEVLRRYVDNIADRELQLLYAVQTLVTQRQHPKGLIQGIFETLYDSKVVSEEGFESWVSADDPLEREGKAVALKMITSFLTWLKDADPESDQEADDFWDISGELQNNETKKNLTSTAMDEGEKLTTQSPKNAIEPERRKIYNRLFLLELRNHPLSLKRPEGLPSLEIVRNKMKRDKIIAAGIFIHQKQSQQTPNAHNTENNTYCFEDLSKTSLEVDKKLAMPNPGPLQGRQTKGNNQFFGRQIRPGNQHMPRPPMAEGTINPNHPPNAPQALPYPGMTSPYLSYPANPPASYPQSGNLPPGNVSFQQPRAAQQTYGYRQTPPYPTFPMKSTPAVFYQSEPQPQQPQQQPQQQQPQQTQQPQQPQQVPVAPPPIAQPRESSGSSRRARSSNLCIVDPNTNRDVLTGEEVLVSTSVVVTPTTTTPPN
ncbi:uncharacterized protein LOC124192564 isoform X3 [Daphnia pulex]|uniref:uncharacterized protein LOC124192564 isoform X3 n=1 Tax=Daphnia pulex TaxID=6669 RepID=UPI001EDD1F08|nr:uncharacterized protein LOC124192564 isoform X3 [Daphnia pulex]